MENAVWQLNCVVYAKCASFMQGVFYCSSCRDIKKMLIIFQEGSRNGTTKIF